MLYNKMYQLKRFVEFFVLNGYTYNIKCGEQMKETKLKTKKLLDFKAEAIKAY